MSASTRREREHLVALLEALERLEEGFSDLPPAAPPPEDSEAVRRVLLEVADRLRNNLPYAHPLYAGHMMIRPHPVARLAHALALWINPNNHSFDGGRASSLMEKEAVAELARMFGWDGPHLGHLCSGGTVANLEALWVAGRLAPGRTVVASTQAHFTHARISQVLQLDFEAVPCDAAGRLDPAALRGRLERGDVGTVVATLGTTATGAVDPLVDLLELREEFGFRLHADAAYGGYFALCDGLAPGTKRSFDALGRVDSIVVDPHKHGLQPYGCGCVLFRDPSVGRFYKHDSPYTYFSSAELHLGEISLECSRPGAAAVALWATQRLLPLARGGEFAGMLGSCRSAALSLHDRLAADERFLTAAPPELDIVVWTPRAAAVSLASEKARTLFHECARRHLHLALAELPTGFFDLAAVGTAPDRETVTCLRSVLVKPEHRDEVPRLWSVLDEACRAL